MVADSRPRRIAIRRSSPAALHTNERSTDARRRGCRGIRTLSGASAFKLLFSTYSTLDGVSRIGGPAGAARPLGEPSGHPERQMAREVILFPVPQSVTPHAARGQPKACGQGSRTWAYGDVAEILHEGSYGAEQPDIERLLRFIESSGYRVIGDHQRRSRQGTGNILRRRSRQIPDDHSTAREKGS